MVYLRGLFVKSFYLSALLVFVVTLSADVESAATKIAYKKPIFGKATSIKEKRFRMRADIARKGTTLTTTFPPTTSTTTTRSPTLTAYMKTTPTAAVPVAPTEVTTDETTTPLLPMTVSEEEDHDMAAASPVTATATALLNGNHSSVSEEEQHQYATPENIQFMLINKTQDSAEQLHVIPIVNNTLDNSDPLEEVILSENPNSAAQEAISREENVTPAEHEIEGELLPTAMELIAIRPTATVPTPKSNVKVPCTCGVFMTSQIKRGSNEQPQGAPVIMNELDRTYPCNSVGQKQCQTKCLETIVQHLPNSANILCATLNRDCRKERAYLYIKNCQNHWWNTSLTAGREYCCRNGQPYQCPII